MARDSAGKPEGMGSKRGAPATKAKPTKKR
jgi:hypothetical protein